MMTRCDSDHQHYDTERLVPIAEICAKTGLDRTTIYRMVRKGQFPKLRKKGDRRVFLLHSEFVEWMREA